MGEYNMIGIIDVQYMPDYARNKRYIVATVSNNQLYFYGATDSPETAVDMEREYPDRITIERTKDYER